ncbi:MAG: DUF6328 family protein [Acidimicrobiales bacterium]
MGAGREEGGDPACWAHLFENDEHDGAGEREPWGPALVVDVAVVDQLGASGTVWSLPHGGDLDGNLVRLASGVEIGEHVNDEVDVLIAVRSGRGELVVEGRRHELRPGVLALIARGARRRLVAGAEGLGYLSLHRRRAPLGIRPTALGRRGSGVEETAVTTRSSERPAETAQEADEEADRRLQELLQEIRVVLPGTTVLFGFLLAVSTSTQFEQFTRLGRVLYLVAFSGAALALVFLLAETGYHRVQGYPYDKDHMVRTSARQALTGLALLGVALVACFGLVVELMYGGLASLVVVLVSSAFVFAVWFGLPLRRRLMARRGAR